MPKKKSNITIRPQDARAYWSNPIRSEQKAQFSILEPETKKPTPKPKQEAVYQREVIPPEEALEQFIGSICFAEYLFKAYAGLVNILELHPYRMRSGWMWDARQEANTTLAYQIIILELPRLSDSLYEKIWQNYYTEEHSLCSIYARIGNEHKNNVLFDSYAQQLRVQLASAIVELVSA